MLGRLGGWIPLVCLACGSERPLELPEGASGFQTAVRVETDGTATYAYVDALDAPIHREPPTPGFELALLLYEPSLAQLELSPGRVFPNEGRFKTPDAARVLEGDPDGAPSWRALPTRQLPGWVEPYRLSGGCRTHRVKPINLPAIQGAGLANQVAGLATITEDLVLVSTFGGRFFRAVWTDEGSPSVTEVATAGDREAVTGGFRSATRLWFGGARGRLASIDLEASRETSELYLERRALLPPNAPEFERTIIGIDGDPERDDDLFMLTVDGTVLHFDGDALTELGQIVGTSTRPEALFETREIRWRGRHQAVAVAAIESGAYPIYEFQVGASPRPLVLPDGAVQNPRAVAYGTAGLFVATSARGADRGRTSRIWLLPPGATDWVLYAEVGFAVLGLAMERYEGVAVGVAGSALSGVLAPQPEGTGPECASIPAATPLLDLRRTGPHAGVAVGFSFFGETNQLLWIR